MLYNRHFIYPAVFIDSDGPAYLYMSQLVVNTIKLNEDMITYDGKVIMPFADAFWGSKFGMLEDKFGLRWMVDCSNAEFVSK